MGESMWTTCVCCSRVILRAHADANGHCSTCPPAINNTHLSDPHEPSEDEWGDLGRPADAMDVPGTVRTSTINKK